MALEAYGEVSNATELLDAQAHIWNHIFNFINSMSLKCAVQLGIPDLISKNERPMPLAQIINALFINKEKAHGVYRLMRILTHSGFFVKVKISEEEEKEGYWLTPSSRLLLRDDPLSMAPLLLAMLDPILMEPWQHVSEWFTTNDHPSVFEMVRGRTRWDDYATREPNFDSVFNEAMASDSRLVARVIVEDFRKAFEGLTSIVDVGGGTGEMAKAIANAFVDTKCTVLDLPHVVAGLDGSENLSYIGGDMFEFIPPANAVLMKWILHCWSDVESVKLLRKCKEAIPCKDKGGKVIIIEMVVGNSNKSTGDDDKAIETQLMFDMATLVLVPGRERTEKKWAKLFCDAGFTSYKIIPLLGLRSLIEIYP